MIRNLSSTVRFSITVGSVALLGLLSVSVADAAPIRRRPSERCDAQTRVVRKLPRHPKSYGGPVAQKPRGPLGLKDITNRLQRGTSADFNDDAAVIQNDAPAARIDAEGQPAYGLRALGVVGPLHLPALTRSFSPRSPRGPPFMP